MGLILPAWRRTEVALDPEVGWTALAGGRLKIGYTQSIPTRAEGSAEGGASGLAQPGERPMQLITALAVSLGRCGAIQIRSIALAEGVEFAGSSLARTS